MEMQQSVVVTQRQCRTSCATSCDPTRCSPGVSAQLTPLSRQKLHRHPGCAAVTPLRPQDSFPNEANNLDLQRVDSECPQFGMYVVQHGH